MPLKNVAFTILAGMSLIFIAHAGESTSEKSSTLPKISPLLQPVENDDTKWGVAIGLRYSKTSFIGEDSTISDILPLFYYEGERFFIRGTEGGVHLWDNDQFGFDAFTRYRFFDYPEEYNDQLDRNTFDAGLRASWMLNENSQVAAEILTDSGGRIHGTARVESELRGNRWRLNPLLEVRAKSSNFNSRYYGLGMDTVGAGVDARAAVKSRLHVWKNLQLEGSLEARWLDSATRSSAYVDGSVEYMAYIGFGVFEDPQVQYTQASGNTLNAKPYLRLAQGWGNDSTLAQIFEADIRKDDVSVNMTSLFYGHPLSDTLFTLPIEIYLTPGLVHHYSSGAQDAATEFVLGFKFFYTLPTPWRVRFGVAEGISYIDSFTYYEAGSLAADDQTPSRLLNYVDLSVDLNLGDIFKTKAIEDLWIGYGIHHRSGIGGSSPTFGNISGGSNYNTLYLQWSSNF